MWRESDERSLLILSQHQRQPLDQGQAQLGETECSVKTTKVLHIKGHKTKNWISITRNYSLIKIFVGTNLTTSPVIGA